MKILIAGGTGQIGAMLVRHWRAQGHSITMLTRTPTESWHVAWDGHTLGPWTKALEGVQVVVNLAGRSVNCRYTRKNLTAMMDSRVESTGILGAAINACKNPPAIWLQASTATIYAHTFTEPNDEIEHSLGGDEPDAPAYWEYSVRIAKNWERELNNAPTPHTRKVALRAAMVMSADPGGVFSTLSRVCRLGLGGSAGGGKQMVSWIHEHDFVRALDFIIANPNLAGAINIAAPEPLPYRKFMAVLRRSWGMPIGLPATKWMLEIAAFFLRTDTELLLKSRWVLPRRLLEAGFKFDYGEWQAAANHLIQQGGKGKGKGQTE